MSRHQHLRLIASPDAEVRPEPALDEADRGFAAPASDPVLWEAAKGFAAPGSPLPPETDGLDDKPPGSLRTAKRAAALAALEDAKLVVLAAEGEPAAAEQLYRRHAGFALNLAARIAGSSAEVEDVVHDAFIRAFEALRGLRNPAAFKTWLGSIVVHGMRSRLRREKLRRVLGLGGAQPVDIDCIASPAASPATRAELAQLYALVGTLAADERIAWTLRFIEGHDLAQTAELCGCSLATIKRRIARAQRYVDDHYVRSAESGEGES